MCMVFKLFAARTSRLQAVKRFYVVRILENTILIVKHNISNKNLALNSSANLNLDYYIYIRIFAEMISAASLIVFVSFQVVEFLNNWTLFDVSLYFPNIELITKSNKFVIFKYVALLYCSLLVYLILKGVVTYFRARKRLRPTNKEQELLNKLCDSTPSTLRLLYRSRSAGPILTRNTKNPTELAKICEGNSEEQESVGDYSYGGYMPLQPQQILHGKYKILRKLGFGHFSTVWLCENIRKKTHLAIKVVKAAPEFRQVACDEIKLLRYAMNKDRNHIGRNHIVEFLCNFNESSINGTHICMGFELMGPSLYRLIVQSDFQGIQQSGVRSVIRQVLTGLVYLHESCHIIHTDLKPENILICVKEPYIHKLIDTANKYNKLGTDKMPKSYVNIHDWENAEHAQEYQPEEEFEHFKFRRNKSYPEDDFMTALEGHPSRHSREVGLYAPMWIDPNIQVKIADLGNACWADRHFSHEIQTMQYRALEVILGANYHFAADMWSVGCIAFELATGEYLFNPKTKSNYSSNDDHIALIWELLDGIPRYITKRGINSHLYFTSEGTLKNIPQSQLKIWKLEDVLEEKYRWKKLDAIWFSGFILSLIEPDPDLRAKASTALANEWLQADDSS